MIREFFSNAEFATSPLFLGELKSWQKVITTPKPEVINFQINDICNARCVMCHIWKKKKDVEITPEQFEKLLKDPFFCEIKHVGITGGEPTLKNDLPVFYKILPRILPKLSGASFITNGFLSKKAVPLYSEIYNHYQSLGLSFGGMVSIDGVGETHDRVRGTKGAFDKAVDTLFGLREQSVSVIACCTIVKENVYDLHHLLDWGKDNGIYIRFRIAEFINRLYNNQLTTQIKNFDQYEIRHLVSFFHLLLTEYEADEQVKKTYTSILSILTGGKRIISCPYQTSLAINLDSQGRFSHCAPKGIPHFLGVSAKKSVIAYLPERIKIRFNNCSSCIHDYHADWTSRQSWATTSLALLDSAMYGFTDNDFPDQEVPIARINLEQLHHVLLVGWYGTETAGDVAILSGIVEEYLKINPKLKITLFSLFPYYTKLTVKEMDPKFASQITVCAYHGNLAFKAMQDCDAIVMAGGPLMDIPQTKMIASLFLWFHHNKKPSIIEGCGVGPLNVAENRQNVLHIFRLASQASVRDQASQQLIRSFGIQKEIQVRNDPSQTYILRTKIQHTRQDSKIIRCFLRELTPEYPQETTPETATQNLSLFLSKLLNWFPQHRLELWSMHYFPVGFDDRLYAQKLANQIHHNRISVELKPHPPYEILQAMAEASFCICMRFHSVVFSAKIDAPFIAIDYTAGGKIKGFLEDKGLSFRMFPLDKIHQIEREQLDFALNQSMIS